MSSVWILHCNECMDCGNINILMVCDSKEIAIAERKRMIVENADFGLRYFITMDEYPLNKEKVWN